MQKQKRADRMADDKAIMRRAVKLAQNALGMTSPNPLVGAVITAPDGTVIGEGWHKQCGGPHAEIEAIRSLENPEAARGAAIYVTLEPCSTFGRTPPCCDAIIKHGFKRVVIGSIDPNPAHAGRAVEKLRSHGIEVAAGVEEKRCAALNRAFFHWIVTKRPYVLLKMAQTLDGRIATVSGSSKWITGDAAARKRVRDLRLWCDAIMTGAETFRLDQPSLTARNEDGTILKTPRRIIATHQQIQGWECVSPDKQEDWDAFLARLGSENVTSLLIEGGGELAASALAAHAVNGLEFHIAPKILGGKHSRPSVGGSDPETVAEAFPLKEMKVRRLGKNLLVTAEIE